MSMEQFLPKAIAVLQPSEGAYYNSGNPILANKIVFENKNISISQEDLDAKLVELQAEYDALQYQRDRQYPTWQEQMDMQYHDEIDGTTTWQDAVAKIKSDNPKPE